MTPAAQVRAAFAAGGYAAACAQTALLFGQCPRAGEAARQALRGLAVLTGERL